MFSLQFDHEEAYQISEKSGMQETSSYMYSQEYIFTIKINLNRSEATLYKQNMNPYVRLSVSLKS